MSADPVATEGTRELPPVEAIARTLELTADQRAAAAPIVDGWPEETRLEAVDWCDDWWWWTNDFVDWSIGMMPDALHALGVEVGADMKQFVSYRPPLRR